jgi:hypothetical protein
MRRPGHRLRRLLLALRLDRLCRLFLDHSLRLNLTNLMLKNRDPAFGRLQCLGNLAAFRFQGRAISRNPIYVAFAFILIGLFLTLPNRILLAYLVAAIWLFNRQVLREETYLKAHYG